MNETTKNLKAIHDSLPDGAIGEIANRTSYSRSYVSGFFAGKFYLSEKNLCILDEADKILDEEKEFDNHAQKKLNTLLSKTRE